MLLTIDTGGTKTLVASFNRAGRPGRQHRFATPIDRDDYIAHLEEIIRTHYDAATLDAVVIAIPGRIENNIVRWCGNLPWEDFDITKALRRTISCPIWVENDANLAGLAEIRSLRKTPRQGIYLTVSTGIGSGVIIDGAIHPALSGSEAGHIMLEYKGKLREWESFASGRAIKRTYGKYAREIESRKTWREIADKISLGLVTIIPALQPEVIVIGGSIGTYFDRYSAQLEQKLRSRLPDNISLPIIRQALHPEEAVIYGCYYYGISQLDA